VNTYENISKGMLIAASIMMTYCVMSKPVQAVEIEVQGEGRADISENFIEVQNIARKSAVKQVVTMAVRKVLGSDAMENPKIQQKFDDIVSQFNVYKVKQSDNSRREGSQYITTIRRYPR